MSKKEICEISFAGAQFMMLPVIHPNISSLRY
jgi:hypothetical protein